MKFLWNLAKKNLSRSRTRTMVSVIAIAIAIISVVFLRGMIGGMLDSTFKNHIHYVAGHIRLIDKEYELKEHMVSLKYTVNGFEKDGYASIREDLIQIEGVEQIVPRLKFGAMVSHEDKMVTMIGWGVEPAEEIRFTEIDQQIAEGRMVKPGEREIVMGVGLLEKIGKKVGDNVTFLYSTAFDAFRGSTYQIVGKIQSNLSLLNDNLFFLPLDQAQRILEMPGEVTELLIITPDYEQAASVLPKIEDFLASNDNTSKYTLQLWNRDYQMIELFAMARTIYNFIYIFIILLACFVLVNTLIMIVNERTREIGMMSALGLKSREILYLFAMEGIIIGAIGSGIGVIVGGIITKVFSIVGMDFGAAMEGMNADLMFEPVFYTVFDLENLIFAFVLGVVVVTIACIIPARMAARLEPNEALR
ncbi:MAG TPA: FtsX-like permease family protein [Atribacterota bacterium]|nr:FtsX-like permease family protein [Atribacterota bacterium]